MSGQAEDEQLRLAAIEAIPFAPERVLELGIGSGETTRHLRARWPEASITGLDSSPEMVFRARELGIEEVRLARMEDPLPDGPWDLVIAVFAVSALDEERRRDLFRRVREQSRSLVIGDRAAIPPEWCGGEVVWQAGDLNVIRAVYD